MSRACGRSAGKLESITDTVRDPYGLVQAWVAQNVTFFFSGFFQWSYFTVPRSRAYELRFTNVGSGVPPTTSLSVEHNDSRLQIRCCMPEKSVLQKRAKNDC